MQFISSVGYTWDNTSLFPILIFSTWPHQTIRHLPTDLQISSLVSYYKKKNAFLVYTLCFHETFHDKWCLQRIQQTKNVLEYSFLKHWLNSVQTTGPYCIIIMINIKQADVQVLTWQLVMKGRQSKQKDHYHIQPLTLTLIMVCNYKRIIF